jgi:predicted DNA-binding ribbon-helix-helix protein
MDQFAPDQNIHPTGPLSSVKKRSVVVHEHSLEDGFWQSLKEIASLRQVSLCEIVNKIDAGRGPANLSSAIRLFVLDYYRQAAHCAVRETVFGT